MLLSIEGSSSSGECVRGEVGRGEGVTGGEAGVGEGEKDPRLDRAFFDSELWLFLRLRASRRLRRPLE